jgi:hypothetical protein
VDDQFLQLVLTGKEMRQCATSSFLDVCTDFLSTECDSVCINIVENVTMKEEMENV